MTLWEMPVPPTALFYDPQFFMRDGRCCSLKLDYEDKEFNNATLSIYFYEVEAFKCTYYRSIDRNISRQSYGRLAEITGSMFLKNINMINPDSDLKHLAITFDDGPCYEFICKRYNIE